MTDDVLKDTLNVEYKGETYVFRIPGYVDEIKLGMHARNIRRELDPEGGGSPEGLDNFTNVLVRGASVFEVLLQSATARWPFSEDKDKKPVVDFRKWPNDKTEEAAAAEPREYWSESTFHVALPTCDSDTT